MSEPPRTLTQIWTQQQQDLEARHKRMQVLRALLVTAETNLLEGQRCVKGLDTNTQKRAGVAAGDLAQVEALITALQKFAPDHPLLRTSSKTFQNPEHRGEAKTHLRVLFEEHFDAALIRMGVADPTSRRID